MPKLALIQMRVEPAAKAHNLARASAWIHQAANAGADIVLLPEAMPQGWTDPSARTNADPVPDGDTCQTLARLAREHRIHLCSGLIERGPDGRLYNAAILLNPAGEVILHHRKIHELDIARDLYGLGDRLGVADTAFGRIGLMICADAFIPGQVISRTLGAMGARWILSPCAWAVPANHNPQQEPYGQLWRDAYGPVAKEHDLWIAGCSNVGPIHAGPWAGRLCIGCSLVVDPTGQPALQGPYGAEAEALLSINIS